MNIAVGSSSFAAADPEPLRLLQSAGFSVTLNPVGRKLAEDEVIELLQEKVGLIAGLEPLSERVFASCPQLRAVARVGIGMDNVDVPAARARGIKVSNTPNEPAEAVAELTVGALIMLMRGLASANEAMHEGRWEKVFGRGLAGSTVVLVGFGRIGRRVGEMLRPFRPSILVVDPAVQQETLPHWARLAEFGEALESADVISLHASGRDCIIGEGELASLKDGAFILNAARGPLIDEAALVGALERGKLGGVWLDVFWEEPYRGPLIGMDRVLLSPHIGTYSRECRLSMELAAASNLIRDLVEH